MFQAELKRAILDCVNRPTNKSARKVNLLVAVKPKADEQGNIDGLRLTFDVKATLPPRTSAEYDLAVTNQGQAVVLVESEDEEADV
jgi:hypothetical protein